MMARRAQCRTNIAKAFHLLVAWKADGGIEFAIEIKEILHCMPILCTVQASMDHASAPLLSVGLYLQELSVDPGE